MPGIVEGFDLRVGLFARRATEEDVVRRLTVERRVEVDEVDAFIAECSPAEPSGCRRSRACSIRPGYQLLAVACRSFRQGPQEWRVLGFAGFSRLFSAQSDSSRRLKSLPESGFTTPVQSPDRRRERTGLDRNRQTSFDGFPEVGAKFLHGLALRGATWDGGNPRPESTLFGWCTMARMVIRNTASSQQLAELLRRQPRGSNNDRHRVRVYRIMPREVTTCFPSVITMCLLWRTIRKPRVPSARTARKCGTPAIPIR